MHFLWHWHNSYLKVERLWNINTINLNIQKKHKLARKREKKMSNFLQFLVPNVTSMLLQPFVITILAFIFILLFNWSFLRNRNTKKKLTTFTIKATHHWKPSPTWLAASPFTPNLSSTPWPSHAASLWQRTYPCCLIC